MKTKIVAILISVLAVVGLSMAPAQAATGTIFIQNTCNSQSAMMVNFQNMLNGTTHNYAQPACTNWGEGPYSTNLPNSEPLSFQVGPGWCASWNINDGPTTITRGGYSGVWQSVHPGSGYGGWWKIGVTQFDC